MTEKEKAQAGYLYNANYDEEILKDINKNSHPIPDRCLASRIRPKRN